MEKDLMTAINDLRLELRKLDGFKSKFDFSKEFDKKQKSPKISKQRKENVK